MDVDAILDKIVAYAYQTLDVDRVAMLLLDEQGELVPKIARDKRGGDAPRAVPQSIARKAVEEKVALLSDNAVKDDAVRRPVDPHAAGPLGDLRAAHRQRGPRARRALRRQRRA